MTVEHVLATTGGCVWKCPHPEHERHDLSGERFSGVYGHRLVVCPKCERNACVDCDVQGICRPVAKDAS